MLREVANFRLILHSIGNEVVGPGNDPAGNLRRKEGSPPPKAHSLLGAACFDVSVAGTVCNRTSQEIKHEDRAADAASERIRSLDNRS